MKRYTMVLVLIFAIGGSVQAVNLAGEGGRFTDPGLSRQAFATDSAATSEGDGSTFRDSGCPLLALDQGPDQFGAPYSDSDCDGCGSGVQVVAENFVVSCGTVTINQIVIWGGYNLNSSPIDDFSVVFHHDSSGTPGVALSTEINVPSSRVDTGVNIGGGIDIFQYTLDLASPVVLPPGTYWIELFNNTTGSTDTFMWETGTVDATTGLPGYAYDLATAPGTSWTAGAGIDLAIQLVTCLECVFSDGFESGNTWLWLTSSR